MTRLLHDTEQESVAETLATSALLAEVRIAEALGAAGFGGPLSRAERRVLAAARGLPSADARAVDRVRALIADGQDPFGSRFSRIRSPAERRRNGIFLTPTQIVGPMVDWVLRHPVSQVVDAGAGTGRFSAAVLRAGGRAVVAVERDPLLAILCRAHLAQIGGDARVLNADYLTTDIGRNGPAAYIGNPPYVRHHDLSPELKEWSAAESARLGRRCSKLAGLHVHFFLATALRARPGDVGCFVTSAEWLDVGYGEFLRWLLLERLGLESLHLLEASAVPFDDAMTTALITCFRPGESNGVVRARVVAKRHEFSDLAGNGRPESRETLASARRWSPTVARAHVRDSDGGLIPLGELARVHRGVATGANDYFVLTTDEAERRGLTEFCRPCITSAQEIIAAGGTVRRTSHTKLLLCVPPGIARADLPAAMLDYLAMGERDGIAERYLCRTRRPWWSLGSPKVAPIVMTYMGRRPPVFARNPDGLLLLNVAHGIHPTGAWTTAALDRLAEHLNRSSADFSGHGRVYHGGLEKFEPREAERLLVPARSSFEVDPD